jgi:hypothetical protein
MRARAKLKKDVRLLLKDMMARVVGQTDNVRLLLSQYGVYVPGGETVKIKHIQAARMVNETFLHNLYNLLYSNVFVCRRARVLRTIGQ